MKGRGTNKRTNEQTDRKTFYRTSSPSGPLPKNRSLKGTMWSAIPVALLCMVVNRNERQGSGPKGDEVL